MNEVPRNYMQNGPNMQNMQIPENNGTVRINLYLKIVAFYGFKEQYAEDPNEDLVVPPHILQLFGILKFLSNCKNPQNATKSKALRIKVHE